MLDVDALADYTQGRLSADDEQTERILARSLAEVRRWCGWHVTPVLEQELILDGPGGPLLRLPTLRVVEIDTVTDDGTELDVDTLEWSRTGMVRKPAGVSWTDRLSGISVALTHGFTADEAADFEAAVFSIADRISQETVGGSPTVVGPFRWAADNSGSAFTAGEQSILEQYRLESFA